MLEGAAEGGGVRNLFPILLIPLHRAITKAQREGRVRRLSESRLGKPRPSDGCAVAAHRRVHLVVEALEYRPCLGIHLAHQSDQWIRTRIHGCLTALIKLLAEGHILEL